MFNRRFVAEIIDNNDPEQKGRVKIFIEHIMENWETDHYPWAFPDSSITSLIPEIGEKWWVWFEEEEYFKKPFYTNKVQWHNLNDANKTIGSLTGSYPNIKYIWFSNGVAIALNSDSAELSITNGSSEIFIAQDGSITIKTGDASIWKPCIIGSCIFSGAPHGGTIAGITKLKGE